MEMVMQYVPIILLVLQCLGGLVIVATLIAKTTKPISDDKVMSKIGGYWLQAVKYLPTLGVNPQTKKLEEALEELKSQLKLEEEKQPEAKPDGQV